MSEPTGSPVQEWLSSHQFSRGNPFATLVADQERAYLAEELFMTVNDYDRIKGPETLIVFALQGGGKSALRVRLSALSLPQAHVAEIMAVECTDFGPLLTAYRQTGRLTEADYTAYLMRQAVTSLLSSFLPAPQLGVVEAVDKLEKVREGEALRRRMATRLAPVDRSLLAGLIRQYAPHLLTAPSLYKMLQAMVTELPVSWRDVQTAVAQQQLRPIIQQSVLADNPPACLLADLCDEPVPGPDARTPLEQLKILVAILETVGFSQIVFLVDRVDEMEPLAGNTQAQADFLQPLLANLTLLELPGVAFKFFLALEMRKELAARTAIRSDRLLNKSVVIHWDKEALKTLLDDRLDFYSRGTVPGFTSLCAQHDAQTIEEQILQISLGSPRRLLTAGKLLIETHVRRSPDTLYLQMSDWEEAREVLLQLMPPRLKLRLDDGVVLVSGKVVKLSKNEVKILKALIHNDGYCERGALITAVWGSEEGVSDYAVDQAISRLRNNKLGDSGANPVYLLTVSAPQRGFRLENWEEG